MRTYIHIIYNKISDTFKVLNMLTCIHTYIHTYTMHTQSTFPVSSLYLCSETLSINIASIDIEHLCEVCSLVVSVWDEDLLRPDDLIGVFTIPMKKIINSYRRSISSNYFFYMTTEVSGTYVFWHINHMYVCMYVCMYVLY